MQILIIILVVTLFLFDESLNAVTLKDGAESVFHVTPAPPTEPLLAPGALGAVWLQSSCGRGVSARARER